MAYNTLLNHNYGSLPAIFPPSKWKRIWVAMTNETLEEACNRAANWSIAIDYSLENYVTIRPEQVYTDIDFSFYFPNHVFLNQDTPISINVSENDKPLENLTEDNFKISLVSTVL